MDHISKIRELIDEIKAEGLAGYNNTGVLNYNLLINPCISESELSDLEAEFGVELPQEYKDYVSHIGNGGNQPGTGMFTAAQSFALVSGRSNDSVKIEYGDLTQYYRSLNLHRCDDLLAFYSRIMGARISADGSEIRAAHSVLDDFFTEDGAFIYQSYLSSDEDLFCKYEAEMRSHILVFSFDDETRTQYAIALDGEHKGKVVYYSYYPLAKIMSGRNIVFTNMTFLEWMHRLYECSFDLCEVLS